MLRATFKNKYRTKGGDIMLVYVVTGPTPEIEDFKLTESIRRNLPVDQLPHDNGKPITQINQRFLQQDGRNPQPAFDLVKNYNGTRYIEDTTKEDAEIWQRRTLLKDKAMAELQAKIELGIDVGEFKTATRRTTATPAGAPIVEPSTLESEIGAGVGEGALEGGGTENLAD